MYKAKLKEDKLHLYLQDKEIGLISPDAKWVKEGDEFIDEDIDEVCNLDIDELPRIFRIKDPCGHFH